MTITASLVKTLRERTGAPMMDCKKALVAAEGDLEQAVEDMRKSGVAKADKKAGRIAAEGVVLTEVEGQVAVIVEINSETDFVARDDNFKQFAEGVLRTALAVKTSDIQVLLDAKMQDGSGSVDDARKALIAKIGENITVRRVATVESKGLLGHYVHSGRIGVIVECTGATEELAKDLAMHIAASNPLALKPEDLPADVIEREKRIIAEGEDLQGKPDDVVEKMVSGRINKYMKEVTLLGQPFVKNPKQSIAQLLKEQSAEIVGYTRYLVGEGIEKEEVNFAEEVKAQVEGS